MTYLATEMLLYLLAAAVIGLVLGWLIFGLGSGRKLSALRGNLMATVEMEREAHQETKRLLDDAQGKMGEAVTAARADADRSLAELKKTVDAERLAAKETEAELERMRGEMEEALQQGRTSGQEAIDQAMHAANAEKAAASLAMAKEAQLRAQLEELRLLIGAEKLAAESARSELKKLRADMQAKLEAERAAGEQAKIALDDIQSTLARTLGPVALGITEQDVDASTAAISGDGARPLSLGRSQAEGVAGSSSGRDNPSPFSMMTDMAAAGEALNNPDLYEADIEDREDPSLDLSSTIESGSASLPEFEAQEEVEVVDPTPPPAAPERIELKSLPMKPTSQELPPIIDGPDRENAAG